jgi:hypothetical protein
VFVVAKLLHIVAYALEDIKGNKKFWLVNLTLFLNC